MMNSYLFYDASCNFYQCSGELALGWGGEYDLPPFMILTKTSIHYFRQLFFLCKPLETQGLYMIKSN